MNSKLCVICQEQPKSKTYFNCKTCINLSCIEKFRKQSYEKQNSKVKNKNPIKKISDKRKLDDIIYKSERIKFLMLPENKICPITKKQATTIHHKKGRLGSLYLDKRFWVALSMEGHEFVEKNPIWAKENGYSLNRLSND